MACHSNAPVVGDNVWYCYDENVGDVAALVTGVITGTSRVNLTYNNGVNSALNVYYSAMLFPNTWGCSGGGGSGFGRGGG